MSDLIFFYFVFFILRLMLIRKIKPKKKVKLNQYLKIVFYWIIIFLLSFLFVKNVLLKVNFSSINWKDSNNVLRYDIWRDQWKELVLQWYVFPISYNFNNKIYNFYVLYDKDLIKYLLFVDKDFVPESFFAKVDWKIKNFLWAIPIIQVNKIKKINQNLSWYTIPDFDANYWHNKIKKLITEYFTPIVRPIPPNAMSFSSYKHYTMYFPRKVYYEVILIKDDLWIKWLYCDNAVLIVWKDKKKYVLSDKFYIRNNARLKIYVCTYDPPRWKDKIPPSKPWMQYMTVKDKSLHFYIEVLNPVRRDFASKIAVRKNN